MSKTKVAANLDLISSATAILAAALSNAQGKHDTLKTVAAADAYMAAVFANQMADAEEKPVT